MKRLLAILVIFAFLPLSFTNAANSNSISLNGTSQWLSTATVWTANQTNVSLECWFKTTDYTQANQAIIYNGNGANSGYGVFLGANGAIDGTIGALAGGIAWFSTATAMTTNNQWNHYALVVDANQDFEIFFNGVSIGTSATSNNIPADGSQIGSDNQTGNRFAKGSIDDCRVWTAARTGANILADYQTELVGNETNLRNYYKLNNALTDETVQANTLTNNGTATFTTDVPFPLAITGRRRIIIIF